MIYDLGPLIFNNAPQQPKFRTRAITWDEGEVA